MVPARSMEPPPATTPSCAAETFVSAATRRPLPSCSNDDGARHVSDVSSTLSTAHASPHTVTSVADAEKPAPPIVSAAPPARLTVAGDTLVTLSAAPLTRGSAGSPTASPQPSSPSASRRSLAACDPARSGGDQHEMVVSIEPLTARKPLHESAIGTHCVGPRRTALPVAGLAKSVPLSVIFQCVAFTTIADAAVSVGVCPGVIDVGAS